VIGRPERERLDRHRRLAATGSDEARSVADEEVPHVVRAMVAVHDRITRIIAHARGAQELDSAVRRQRGLVPDVSRTSAFHQLVRTSLEPLHRFDIVRMILKRQAQTGASPPVPMGGIQ